VKAAGPVICGRRQQPAINQMVQRALRSPSVSEATRRFPLLLGKCSSLLAKGTTRCLYRNWWTSVTDLLEVDKIRTMVMATVIEVMMMMMVMIMLTMNIIIHHANIPPSCMMHNPSDWIIVVKDMQPSSKENSHVITKDNTDNQNSRRNNTGIMWQRNI